MTDCHAWHRARAEESMSAIITALSDKPMTRGEMVDATGYTKSRIGYYICRMHMEKLVHITAWRRQECGHGNFLPVFALGNAPDAPKLKIKTQAQIAKDVRRKIKSDPSRRIDYLMKARARETRRGKKKVAPDPFIAQFAGLFGKTQQEAA